MKLLIEEYRYNASAVKECLSELKALKNIYHLVSMKLI